MVPHTPDAVQTLGGRYTVRLVPSIEVWVKEQIRCYYYLS